MSAWTPEQIDAMRFCQCTTCQMTLAELGRSKDPMEDIAERFLKAIKSATLDEIIDGLAFFRNSPSNPTLKAEVTRLCAEELYLRTRLKT